MSGAEGLPRIDRREVLSRFLQLGVWAQQWYLAIILLALEFIFLLLSVWNIDLGLLISELSGHYSRAIWIGTGKLP